MPEPMVNDPGTSARRRVLIVGAGAGPARALREVLRDDGHHYVTLCTRRPIDIMLGEVSRVVGDYRDAPVNEADIVVNFVGQVSGSDAALYRQLNVDLPVELARRARAAGVRRLIHLSTLSLYGRARDIGSSTPADPRSLYGSTKLEGDTALLSLATPDFRVTVLRAPAIYGPGLRGKLATLTRVMNGVPVFVAPAEDGPRSTLHVRHLAFAIAAVIDADLDGLRFAADPWPFSLSVLAHAMASRGRPVTILRMPDWSLASLKAVVPGAYQSLFGRSVIAPDDVVLSHHRNYLGPDRALEDLLD